MTENRPSYNLRTLRELMIAAFDASELRALAGYDAKLKEAARVFAPTDSITELVDKAILWCERRGLIPYLVQRIGEERPDAYKRLEAELFPGGVGEPPAGEPAGFPRETLTVVSPIYLDLVRVPAGVFLMGSVAARDERMADDELPPHQVYLPEFHIGQYPVTNLQYTAFVKASHYKAPLFLQDGEVLPGWENHPVVGVQWEDAQAFCAWLREETGEPFRLPTEAEWEKAARGTDGRIYPWGDQPPDASLCNFCREGGGTTPIGRHSPQGDSPYGCADMAGNVWEWCQSLYRPYPYRPGDGREDVQAVAPRVLRGGAFFNIPGFLRCAVRNGKDPDFRHSSVGFRVASGLLRQAL